MPDHNLNAVTLGVALARATVTPFTQNDWHGWAGAMGDAQIVYFTATDHAALLAQLGMAHVPAEYVTVILDDGGVTWNVNSPVNMYAWAVTVEMPVSNYEPPSATEYWAVDPQRPYGTQLDQFIATLPADVRTLVMACPEAAREHVVRGYLDSAAARAVIDGKAPAIGLPALPKDMVAQALRLLENADMSSYGGLYDAVPWGDLEAFAQGSTMNPDAALALATGEAYPHPAAPKPTVWIFRNELGMAEARGEDEYGGASKTLFQDGLETCTINWVNLNYGTTPPHIVWRAPTAAEVQGRLPKDLVAAAEGKA